MLQIMPARRRPRLRRFAGLACCFMVASLGTAVPPLAQQPLIIEKHFDPESSRFVHYGDLNLAEPTAQRTLYHRVKYAVYDLCGINPTGWSGIYPKATRTCSDEAWAIASTNPTGAFGRGLALSPASEITSALGE